MSVEFIGFITTNNSSETIVRNGPVLDRHHIEKLVGTGVTFVLVVKGIAVLPQLGGIAAGDDMQRNPAPGKLIDGRELARDQGRGGKARPLRDQHAIVGIDQGAGHDQSEFDASHVLPMRQKNQDRGSKRIR